MRYHFFKEIRAMDNIFKIFNKIQFNKNGSIYKGPPPPPPIRDYFIRRSSFFKY